MYKKKARPWSINRFWIISRGQFEYNICGSNDILYWNRWLFLVLSGVKFKLGCDEFRVCTVYSRSTLHPSDSIFLVHVTTMNFVTCDPIIGGVWACIKCGKHFFTGSFGMPILGYWLVGWTENFWWPFFHQKRMSFFERR